MANFRQTEEYHQLHLLRTSLTTTTKAPSKTSISARQPSITTRPVLQYVMDHSRTDSTPSFGDVTLTEEFHTEAFGAELDPKSISVVSAFAPNYTIQDVLSPQPQPVNPDEQIEPKQTEQDEMISSVFDLRHEDESSSIAPPECRQTVTVKKLLSTYQAVSPLADDDNDLLQQWKTVLADLDDVLLREERYLIESQLN